MEKKEIFNGSKTDILNSADCVRISPISTPVIAGMALLRSIISLDHCAPMILDDNVVGVILVSIFKKAFESTLHSG